MSHPFVYRGHILHHHRPHHCHDGHPSIDGMAAYQLHIERGKHIHRHDRRDEPEGPVVDAPEAPVHQDVAYQVQHIGALRAVPIGSRGIVELSEQVGAEEVGDIIQAGDDDPRWIDAQQALAVEGTYSRRCGGAGARRCEITVRGCGGAKVRRCGINVWRFVAILVPPYPRTFAPPIRVLDPRNTLRPREPQADATQEEKHIHTDIAQANQTVHQFAFGHRYVEKHHEKHGQSHQCRTVAAQHFVVHSE